jgi:hypothetical protein
VLATRWLHEAHGASIAIDVRRARGLAIATIGVLRVP